VRTCHAPACSRKKSQDALVDKWRAIVNPGRDSPRPNFIDCLHGHKRRGTLRRFFALAVVNSDQVPLMEATLREVHEAYAGKETASLEGYGPGRILLSEQTPSEDNVRF
jgi:hypothetical protein